MSTDLLLSAGRGPRECAWALGRLLDRLEAAATRHKLTVARLEEVAGDDRGTYRSVLIRITGPRAAGFAAGWTERQLSLNRRLALDLLRERLEAGNRAAARAVATTRWHIHDELVRGDPTRVERP